MRLMRRAAHVRRRTRRVLFTSNRHPRAVKIACLVQQRYWTNAVLALRGPDGLRLRIDLLDHPILDHSTESQDVAAAVDCVHRFELDHGEGAPTSRYLLRLRDGVGAFLEQARLLGCVIHVYTMGSFLYTQKVLDFLDPAEVYFVPPGKILCRPEGGAVFKKSIAHLLPDSDAWRHVLIVDDREDARHGRLGDVLAVLSSFGPC